jgi:hypothetical protein
MFSVVKQGREILKVHFMSHYLFESENTGANFNVRRNDPFNKILQITIIEAIKQQIPEVVL